MNVQFPGQKVEFALPRLGGPIIARADGKRSFNDIYQEIKELDTGLSLEQFELQARGLVSTLNRIGKLYLRAGA